MSTKVSETGDSTRQSRLDFLSDRSTSNLGKRGQSDINISVRLPLVTETNRIHPIPDIVSLIVCVVLYLQVLFGSWFLFSDKVPRPAAVRTILLVFFFGLAGEYHLMLGAMIALPIVALISTIVLGLILWYYASRNEIEKWETVTLRWWFGTISPVLIVPTALSCLSSFGNYALLRDFGSVCICTVNTLALGCVFTFLFFLTVPLLKSPYLSNTTVMMWRPEVFYRGYCVLMVPIMMGRVFDDFAPWCHYIPYFVTFVCSGGALYYFIEVPLAGIVGNVLWLSLPVMAAANQIWNCAREAGAYPGDITYFCGSLAVDVMIVIIVGVFFYLKRRKLSQQLSYSAIEIDSDSTLTFEKKFGHLDKVLCGKQKFAFFVMQVGLEDRRELLYDWTIVRFYHGNYREDQDIIIFAAWIVSFFPSETVLLQSLLSAAESLRGITDTNLVMFSQLKRVSSFRENTTSIEAMSDVAVARAVSDDCATIISNFWKSAAKGYMEPDESICGYLGHYITKADSAWLNVMDKYPNSAGIAAEYSLYLLDGKCAFEQAIKWHRRSLEMDAGHRLRRDKMFQRFIQMFPSYLKTGIVDVTGRIAQLKDQAPKPNQSASASAGLSSSAAKTSAMSSENDSGSLELDSVRTNTFLENASLRVALERYASGFPTAVVENSRILLAFKFFFSVVFILLAMLMLTIDTADRQGLLKCVAFLTEASHYVILARQKIDWLVMERFFTLEEKKMLSQYFTKDTSVLNTSTPTVETIVNLTNLALDYMDILMLNIFRSSTSAEYGSFLTTYNLARQSCSSGKVQQSYWNYSLDATLRDYTTEAVTIARSSEYDRVHFAESDDFCDIIVHGSQLQSVMEAVTAFISPEFGQRIQWYEELPTLQTWSETQKPWRYIMAFTPFFMLLFLVPFVIHLLVTVSVRGRNLLECMIRAPSHICLAAAERIESSISSKRASRIPRRTHDSHFSGVFLDLLLTIIIIILIEVLGMVRLEIDKDLDTMMGHYSLINMKRTYTYSISRDVAFLIFVTQLQMDGLTGYYTDDTGKEQTYRVTSCPYMSPEVFNNSLFATIQKYRVIEEMQIHGYDNVPSMTNYDKEADETKHVSVCNPYDVIMKPNSWATDVNFYRCVSFDRVESFFIEKAISLGLSNKHSISDPSFSEMMHIANSRAAVGYTTYLDEYLQRAEEKSRLINMIGFAFLACALVFECLALWRDSVDIYRAIRDLEMLKTLFLKLDPLAVVQAKELLSALHIFSNKPKEKVISACQVVVQNSKEVILGVSNQNVIDMATGEVMEVFGYLSDQLLGQPLSQFIDKVENEKLYYQMQLMLTGQCALTYETDAIGVRDNGSKFSLHVVLIGLSSNGRAAESMVLVCRDIEEDQELKVKIEEAKRTSEHILEYILPNPALKRSFTDGKLMASECTVLYADIDAFATWCSQMPPRLVLHSLSRIFSKFDELLVAQESVTKVNQLSDTYLAIGGLFNDQSDGASSITAAALDMLASMDGLNIELHSSLTVRFGVHTGGPVYAGVIGTEKQYVFHVVGAAINVAIDLCHTCQAGYVHLSESAAASLEKGTDKEVTVLDDNTVLARKTQKGLTRADSSDAVSAVPM